MHRPPFVTVAAGTTLWLAGLAGTTLATAPDQVRGDAQAEQQPGGGQVSAAVSVTEVEGYDGLPSEPGPKTRSGRTNVSGSLATYRWVPTGVECWAGWEIWDEASQSMVVLDENGGAFFHVLVRVDRSTVPPTQTEVAVECVRPDETPDSPPPPTLTEMSAFARALIVAPDVRVSPDPEIGTVTGLETWFWYDGQDEVTATAEIRDYNVTATMRPSRHYWDRGEPRGVILESDRPGSEEDPAARWVYETKGGYDVRMHVVWDGTWSFTGSGVAASGDLPTIIATGVTDYGVDEVRSELTGTR